MSYDGINSFGESRNIGCWEQICSGFSRAGNAISYGFTCIRGRNTFVDFAFTSTLRAIDSIAHRIFGGYVFDEVALQMVREREWKQEVADLRESLKSKPYVPKFCSATAACVNAVVLKLGGFGLRKAPEKVEYWVFWRLAWYLRYAYRQFCKQGAKDKALNSRIARYSEAQYNGLSTRITHAFAPSALHSLINVEHLLLKVCQHAMSLKSDVNKSLCFKAAVFRRIAKSLGQQKDLAQVRKSRESLGEGAQKIAILDWLKKNADLPAGMPDPEGLDSNNLAQKEQEALYKFISTEVEKIIKLHAPDFFKSGITGWAYKLEGDQLTDLITTQIISLIFDQIGDPDKFAQAILYSQDEVLDLEVDGFGMEKEEQLLNTGHQILEAVTSGKSTAEVQAIFKKSNLKQCPGGEEGNRQREATRARLEEYFASILLKMFQEESTQDATSNDKPIIGAASLGGNLLMQGMSFVIGYLKKFGVFATSQVHPLIANYFAKRVVSLIYHPSWKIILLQVLQEVSHTLQKKEDESQPQFRIEDFDKITHFFGEHFFGEFQASSVPSVSIVQSVGNLLGQLSEQSLGKILSDFFLYQERNNLFGQFETLMYKRQEPPVDLMVKGMELSIPTLKEVTLYCRVVDALRKKSKSIESDDKFWEFFLRIILPKLAKEKVIEYHVNTEILTRFESIEVAPKELLPSLLQSNRAEFEAKPATQAEMNTARVEVIDDLLNMNDDELLARIQEISRPKKD